MGGQAVGEDGELMDPDFVSSVVELVVGVEVEVEAGWIKSVPSQRS